MGNYIPSTTAERQQMLDTIGIKSVDELFSAIPESVRLRKLLNLPRPRSEFEVRQMMEGIAAKNIMFPTILRGAGAYYHYIPSIVKYITSKEEFVTAYTPYQAEISQGLLQSIFEYQTMICELTGMDVSNASVYDGAGAAAEAVAMCRDRGRIRVLVAATAHPDVIATVATYCFGSGMEVVPVPEKDGATDLEALKGLLDETTACLYIQQPNFYGVIEDADAFAAAVHAAGAKLIMGCNPIALGILKTPAEDGADIAVGEGQPLGIPMAYGGPYLGFMAAKTSLTRKLPGRIVGETQDVDGKRAFVLTLQAREQHIRREKASSNICSNEALCALAASVYLSAMGPGGLAEVASQCWSKAHYFAAELCAISGIELKYQGEFFHEFVATCPVNTGILLQALENEGILGGLPVDGGILWCVTEMCSKEQLDQAVKVVREVCGNETDF